MEFKILFWHSIWVVKSYIDIQNPILTFELRRKIVFKIQFFTYELCLKIVLWQSKSYFGIRTESEYAILASFKILFWHSNWVGKCYFGIQNPFLTFELSVKIVFSYLKSYFDIRTESENRIQNLILTFELSRKIVFWHTKSYFDTRTESENALLVFKVIFWHSNRIGKCYFHIQNPILTFDQRRKIVIWYSKSYFDIRTESENRILIFKILIDIRNESENPILLFKILFWQSNWYGKCYFDIQNRILTFELSWKTVFW